ncbi:hypothetical protein [Saccharolobus shibatae]|uniref:Uncharacterized protein n=1 Tax=Saccharolobus shibatae TaxID=2286 RepID=A0A8F5GVC2_9CREN|nr:hypothetical protein [Saccharolobus shibatae]QXJ31003.1 hypothetical protein J5U21_00652 [Saccharolobus shibatae]
MNEVLQSVGLVVFTICYIIFLLMVSNSMKRRAKLLRDKLKVEFPLKFLEKSVDFLSSSEFAELMNELSLITNLSKINKNSLISDFYSRSPMIEKELEDLLLLISITNRIDNLSKDLERKSRLMRIAGIFIFLDILALIIIIRYFPSVDNIMYFILIGIMIGLLFIIFESFVTYAHSERYMKI